MLARTGRRTAPCHARCRATGVLIVISITTTNDDLAFLRNLLDSDRGIAKRRKFGILYFVSGIAWAPSVLLEWAQLSKMVLISREWIRYAYLASTLILVVAMVYAFWRDRNAGPKTTANRAFSAAFAGIGYSYLVVLAMLVNLASQRGNDVFYLVYAVVLFAGQGAGWYVAWALQRQAWLAFVAVGWYTAALIAGLNVLSLPNFLLATSISLLLLMAVPGWVMMQKSSARKISPNVDHTQP
jgi:hypothetical protein